MNKYQEALKDLVDRFTGKGFYVNSDTPLTPKETLTIIQELVDKATPKKPIYVKDHWRGHHKCPTCNSVRVVREVFILDDCAEVYLTHCPDCDQKLDWD